MSRAGSLRAVPFLHRHLALQGRASVSAQVPGTSDSRVPPLPRPRMKARSGPRYYSGRVASPPSRLILPRTPPSQPWRKRLRLGCFGWGRAARPGNQARLSDGPGIPVDSPRSSSDLEHSFVLHS